MVFHPAPRWNPGLGHSSHQLVMQPLLGNCLVPKGPASPARMTTPSTSQLVQLGHRLSALLPQIWNIPEGPPQFQCSPWDQLESLWQLPPGSSHAAQSYVFYSLTCALPRALSNKFLTPKP